MYRRSFRKPLTSIVRLHLQSEHSESLIVDVASATMNLNLPGEGLGRGRVWRSQAWFVGSQTNKPWLGTLNWGLSESGACGKCSWAEGHDPPYIQQRFVSESSVYLDDVSLPSPTSSPTSSPTHHDLQQKFRDRTSTSSSEAADDVVDAIHSLYVSDVGYN